MSIKHGNSWNIIACLRIFGFLLLKKYPEREFNERENCRWCADKNMKKKNANMHVPFYMLIIFSLLVDEDMKRNARKQ